MKISAILTAAAVVVGVSARDRFGFSPEGIINQIQAEGEWNRWPAVVHCVKGDIYGNDWSRTDAYITNGLFSQKKCTITWCDPDKGWCKFELKGDGGAQNWWEINWHRDGNKLCYPRPCDQM
ncbi:hypothetical protein ABW20_dc0107055 [Dactylellina cionopaga]|nr:hypothetical protein ABW20_dc0107055 [Dactylellina cionopaga]